MATPIKLDVEAVGRAVLATLVANMNKITDAFKKSAEGIAPTDTGEYSRGFRTNPAKIEGLSLVGEIGNYSRYAQSVETGFRKVPVKWHKGPPRSDSTVIYVGVGAHVQQRVSQEFIPKIPKLLGSKQ